MKKKKKPEKLEQNTDEESLLTMLISEDILKRDWNNELDKRWNSFSKERKKS